MAIKVGKHTFKFMPHGVLRKRAWVANCGRLVVRPSVVRPAMWCADYQVGGDHVQSMHREDGMTRRFRTKEKAMTELVKFWDAI